MLSSTLYIFYVMFAFPTTEESQGLQLIIIAAFGAVD